MNIDFLLSLIFAGFIYIVTPGPVFISIISLSSERGRLEVLKLVFGVVFGCCSWFVFTIFSIKEASRLSPDVFLVLTLFCSLYLFLLGYKMIKRTRLNKSSKEIFVNPFKDGLALGFLNPKSYPVMLSVFSALIANNIQNFEWTDFPIVFLFSLLGFVFGYAFMIAIAGMKKVSELYLDHIKTVSIGFGLLYIGFGLHLLINIRL